MEANFKLFDCKRCEEIASEVSKSFIRFTLLKYKFIKCDTLKIKSPLYFV